jgi:hypothetical protein
MNIETLVNAVIWLTIVGLVFWLLWWLVGYINPPEPFNKVIRVIIAVVGVLILLNFLLGLTGSPIVRLR